MFVSQIALPPVFNSGPAGLILQKFGKHLQKRQLDLPEYAASFVNYKALKKLIKHLSATPTIAAQNAEPTQDPQAALQANKATFFFRLERELEKVNVFYLQKEAELKLRLKTLLDKKKVMQSRSISTSKLSASFITLQEGFEQFSSDLNKLEQFADVNATAFSKILKKWDKTSKSRTKELYLSRAVEVQPCFNHEVISDLSDQATTSLLELGAWAEGEKIQYNPARSDHIITSQIIGTDESDLDAQLLQAALSGNHPVLTELTSRVRSSPDAKSRFTRTFLTAISEASIESLQMLLATNLVDLQAEDEINERNCLHEAAISGRQEILDIGLSQDVDPSRMDVYGRLPLHYASMHGRVPMVIVLLQKAPETINDIDHDNFSPVVHGIIHHQIDCVRKLLDHGSRIEPEKESDHIPLNLACQYGSTDIIELLLERKARILADAEGLYPQHHVARKGDIPENLLVLKKYGADLDLRDKLYQWTPLFHAVSEGNEACVRILLQQGVKVDIKDEKDLTPMYYAVWEGHLECMKQLQLSEPKAELPRLRKGIPATDAEPMNVDGDGIPDLSLPPPIIPLRRYGHNFLDKKAFVQLTFDKAGTEAVQFYNDSKYPAARLTISSKSSDLIPRNLMLPIQEDSKHISFQVDNLDLFTIDFDVYPTFGSKIIARTVALPSMFQATSSSSGIATLPLFDPRLRLIGHINFRYQVIKPFQGIPLEVTQFETYWKATSFLDIHPSSVITGSSLSGEYLQLSVQLTSDGVPVSFSRWTFDHQGIQIPTGRTMLSTIQRVQQDKTDLITWLASGKATPEETIKTLASHAIPLKTILEVLEPNLNINIHVLYPNEADEDKLGLGPALNINDFVDAILTDVFNYSRAARERNQGRSSGRSIIFSSYNPDICTAINWKQPNYPVLLCNSIGSQQDPSIPRPSESITIDGEYSLSVKEAVRIAQTNNFMGLVCTLEILEMAPSLMSTIKVAGLVVVADTSSSSSLSKTRVSQSTTPQLSGNSLSQLADTVNGVLDDRRILKFYDSIDM